MSYQSTGLPSHSQRGHMVLAGCLDQLALVVVWNIDRVERDALDREHAVRGDAVVTDRHRLEHGTEIHGSP